MSKNKPVTAGSVLTVEDITAWYQDNPFTLGNVETYFPSEEQEEDTWKTVAPTETMVNEAADPLSQHASIPVSGREGFKTIMGGMVTFGKGRPWTSEEMEKFESLKSALAKTNNPAVAQQLLDYYGNDLNYLRTAMEAEKLYLCYALLSNACNISFVASNSPYMAGITAMSYPVASWQKTAVGTAWSNVAADILGDIQSMLDLAESKGKVITKLKINKTWWTYVRNNTAVQKYCATMAQNLYSTQAPPSLEAVNTMLADYFDIDLAFEVVNEKITRVSTAGVKTTANPFADGVVVATAITKVGRFAWKPLYIDDATREAYESFYVVGNYKQVDPSLAKFYSKGKGFPVVDTYADNIYMRVNAVAW